MDMVFLPNTGSVVVRSSQGRFFFVVFTCPGSKKDIFVLKFDSASNGGFHSKIRVPLSTIPGRDFCVFTFSLSFFENETDTH